MVVGRKLVERLLGLLLVLVLVELLEGVVVRGGGLFERRCWVVLLAHLEYLVVITPLLLGLFPLGLFLLLFLLLILRIPLQPFEKLHFLGLLLFRSEELLRIKMKVFLFFPGPLLPALLLELSFILEVGVQREKVRNRVVLLREGLSILSRLLARLR